MKDLLSEARTDVGAKEHPQPPAAAQDSGPVEQQQHAMDPLVLVFLDNPIARRLVVAWKTCAGDEDQWLEYAGIARSEMDDARRLCFALRQNKICTDGGAVNAVALSYVRTIVAAPLTKNVPNGGKRRGRR